MRRPPRHPRQVFHVGEYVIFTYSSKTPHAKGMSQLDGHKGFVKEFKDGASGWKTGGYGVDRYKIFFPDPHGGVTFICRADSLHPIPRPKKYKITQTRR